MAESLKVTNEWGTLRKAIAFPGKPEAEGGNVIDISEEDWHKWYPPEQLARHPEYGPVDSIKLCAQQAAYLALLRRKGVNFVQPEMQEGAFCQVFTRDPCGVVDKTLYIGRMGESYRKLETPGLDPVTDDVDIQNIVRLTRGTLEFGDMRVCLDGIPGKKSKRGVIVGLGELTDRDGFEELKEQLNSRGIKAEAMPHDGLHLDCVLLPTPRGDAFYSPTKLPRSSRKIARQYLPGEFIPLDPDEDKLLATNAIWLNPQEIVSTNAVPKLNAVLREMGYTVDDKLDFHQPANEWGGVRCTVAEWLRESLWIRR